MFLLINWNYVISNFIIALVIYTFCAILDKKYRNIKVAIILILTGTILGYVVRILI
jgi:hypothetical protein